VLAKRIDNWLPASLQQSLAKAGERLLMQARHYWLLLAEAHPTRRKFAATLRRAAALPVPARWPTCWQQRDRFGKKEAEGGDASEESRRLEAVQAWRLLERSERAVLGASLGTGMGNSVGRG
jgi:hypothetical protein